MEVAEANRRWRWPFRWCGSCRESAVAQLFTSRSLTHMLTMIKRLFILLWLVTMASVSLHAGEPSLKISLGIRDAKLLTITNVAFPLAFRIENAGKTAINGGSIRGIYHNAVVNLLAKSGLERHYDFASDGLQGYGLVPNDLQPGQSYVHGYVGNIITLFPSAKDGDYQVWWTLGDLKSNILCFTVTNGKVLPSLYPF